MKHSCGPLDAVCSLIFLACLVPAPTAGQDQQVNTDPPGTVQNEVSLSLSPLTSSDLVMTYNDFGPSGGLGVSFSVDGGVNWADRTVGTGIADPFGGPALSLVFDPISGADLLGNFYAGYIASGPNNGFGGDPSGLYIQLSGDSGNSWSAPVAVHNEEGGTPGGSNNSGTGPYRFNDKPHFATDNWSTSPNQTNVYVAWVQDDGVNPQTDLLFSGSADQGSSWFATPTVVNDSPGTDMANGPNVAVAADGTIYVAWLDVNVTNVNRKPATLMIDKSTDGGVSFGSDTVIRSITSLPNNLTTLGGLTDARSRSYPSIAVSPSNPAEVYLVYAEDPDGAGPDEADVFFLKSFDGGGNWSTPLRLNTDLTNTDQFEPWLAVNANGAISVAWYDRRNSPGLDTLWDVYLAQSLDAGTSFTANTRATFQSFPTPQTASYGPWFGEYLGLVMDTQYTYVGFTSGINDPNAGDVFFNRVAVAVIPEPSAFALWLIGAGALWASRRRIGC